VDVAWLAPGDGLYGTGADSMGRARHLKKNFALKILVGRGDVKIERTKQAPGEEPEPALRVGHRLARDPADEPRHEAVGADPNPGHLSRVAHPVAKHQVVCAALRAFVKHGDVGR